MTKAINNEKLEAIAKNVMEWATDHYDSKTYAWHRLVETMTIPEMVEDMIAAGATTARKALVLFRTTAYHWAQQEAEHRAMADW